MGHTLAGILLAPLLLTQGWITRRRTPRLPEPPGPREGSAGRGPILRLLIAGDSAAAGVGASHQDEALLGRVVSGLQQDFRVEWSLRARTGATTASALAELRRVGSEPFDVAVLSLGVNDVTSGVGLGRWRRRQADLRSLLRTRFDVSCIVASGLPPVGSFPALPQPLRWYLGTRAERFDLALRSDVQEEPDCRFVALGSGDTSLMAPDGFHPGPGVYAVWGRRVAETVAACLGEGPPGDQEATTPVRGPTPGSLPDG